MLKRYLEKLISFGCSLQDVPRVDVVYEMPEGQNYHLVKYISGSKDAYMLISMLSRRKIKNPYLRYLQN